MRKMLEILPQVPCWKERVDQMTLLVGDAGLLSVVGTGVNHYTRGRGRVYLPGGNLAAFK